LDTRLGFWGKEIEVVFAVLLANRVIGLDFHGSEGLTRLRDPVANQEIVTEVQKQQRQSGNFEDALHRRTPLSFLVVVVGKWRMAEFGTSRISHASTLGTIAREAL